MKILSNNYGALSNNKIIKQRLSRHIYKQTSMFNSIIRDNSWETEIM